MKNVIEKLEEAKVLAEKEGLKLSVCNDLNTLIYKLEVTK